MNPSKNIAFTDFDNIYFVGIGGIGMSALARYFKSRGFNVGGYDKTATTLTDELIKEDIAIHFNDLGSKLPSSFSDLQKTLFIYTPAIPKEHQELQYIKANSQFVFKRSQVLGLITQNSKGLGVAGTHGKTTTSSMLAYILDTSIGCNAFLGGIASNFNSNLVLHPSSEYTVVEADEFDRSFLQLHPFASIVTACDPDHLDIYHSEQEFLQGFQDYIELIDEKGFLVIKENLPLKSSKKTITYALNSETATINGSNLRYEKGDFLMDVNIGQDHWKNVHLGIPGIHNAENALACIGMCINLGLNEDQIRKGLANFKGVKRRFEYHIKREDLIFIDDYAHHPTEIKALLKSAKLLYPDKKITGIFQPHLFSRTKDFFDDFAKELSRLDEVILMPIYPARELPIEGITSDELLKNIQVDVKTLLAPEEVIPYLKAQKNEVIITIGAGDIDRIVEPIKMAFT